MNLIPEIVRELFPTNNSVEHVAEQVETSIPPVTLRELELVSTRLYPEKAPGPDGVPNEVLKIATKTHPAMFQKVYSRVVLIFEL